MAGTPSEREAARVLARELGALGYEPEVEEFEILRGQGQARLWADGDEFPCSPFELTGSGEFEGPVNFGARGVLKEQVILTPEYPRGPQVARWAREGALGFVWVRSPKGELRKPVIGQEAAERWKLVPGVAVDWEVGLRLRWAKRIRVEKREEIHLAKSQNVVITVKGSKFPEKVVLFGAHYDSVPESPGGVDNLGGVLALLGLAKHLREHPPEKTAILAFFGAEERGLLGSKAFVRRHQEILGKILLVVNLDVLGDPLGILTAIVLGSADMAKFARKIGVPKVRRGTYSSDGMPFALEASVPSISLAMTGPSNFWGHTPRDRWISPEALEAVQPTVNRLADEVLKGRGLPFEARIPKALQKEVKRYFKERGAI